MKSNFGTKICRSFHKTGFLLKKNSPEILAFVGVIGVVATVIVACKETMNAGEIIDDTSDALDEIHSKEDEKAQEETVKVYAKASLEFAKLYAPAVVLGTASIACLLASNGLLRKRNAALASAYASLDVSFKKYRKAVIDKYGKEEDQRLRFKTKDSIVEEDGVDANGDKKYKVTDYQMENSDYAKFFDEASYFWEKDPEANLMFLRDQQALANEELVKHGYLFLNTVYKMLGIPETEAGKVVGWVYDECNPIGDNYVDFGIYDPHKEKNRDFVNGYERSIILDFNVDSYILDKI